MLLRAKALLLKASVVDRPPDPSIMAELQEAEYAASKLKHIIGT
jgi:hypothetical protein